MSRLIFDTDTDPGMQVVITGKDSLGFSNNDDWCGDSETGFGATVAVELTREQVSKLHSALGDWLATQEPPQ